MKQVENSRHYYTTMLRQIVKRRPRGGEVYVSGGETFHETAMLLYFLLLQSAMVRWMRSPITRRLPVVVYGQSTSLTRRYDKLLADFSSMGNSNFKSKTPYVLATWTSLCSIYGTKDMHNCSRDAFVE